MYAGYDELCELPAAAYLEWENFRTPFDVLGDEMAQKQYVKGLKYGKKSKQAKGGAGAVQIRADGTWGCDLPATLPGSAGGYVSSYEGIGYHRATADLLRGFIDSGARIVVHRWNGPAVVIQE